MFASMRIFGAIELQSVIFLYALVLLLSKQFVAFIWMSFFNGIFFKKFFDTLGLSRYSKLKVYFQWILINQSEI